MTICIAALADEGNAIVCVADKMLSFTNPLGDYAQWDSDVTKIIPIPKTSIHAFIAGSLGHCEAVLSELYDLEDIPANKSDKNPPPDENLSDLIVSLEEVYRKKYQHFQ